MNMARDANSNTRLNVADGHDMSPIGMLLGLRPMLRNQKMLFICAPADQLGNWGESIPTRRERKHEPDVSRLSAAFHKYDHVVVFMERVLRQGSHERKTERARGKGLH